MHEVISVLQQNGVVGVEQAWQHFGSRVELVNVTVTEQPQHAPVRQRNRSRDVARRPAVGLPEEFSERRILVRLLRRRKRRRRRLEPEEDCEENPNERSVRQPIAGQNEFVKPGVQVTWSFAGRTLGLSAIVIRRSVNNSTATSSTSHKQAQGLCRALGSRFTIEVSQENGGIR